MPDIRQRIALDGGDDVKRQLGDIGQAGQAAFSGIQNAAQRGGDLSRSINLAGVRQQIVELANAARTLLSTFDQVAAGAQNVQARLSAVGGSAASAGRQAEQSGQSFASIAAKATVTAGAIAALGIAIFSAAKQAATGAKAIGDAATESGASLEGFQKAKFIFQQMGLSEKDAEQAVSDLAEKTKDAVGAAADKLKQLGFRFANTEEGIAAAKATIEQFGAVNVALDPLLQKLAKLGVVIPAGFMNEAKQELVRASGIAFDNNEEQIKAATEAAKGLGLIGSSLEQLKDKTPDVVGQLRSIAETIALMGNETAQKQAAINALGDDVGEKLVDKLKKGGAGIDEFLADFSKLGLGVKQNSVDLGESFAAAMARFTTASQTARIEFGSHFLPIVTEGIRQFTNLMRTNRPEIDKFATETAGALKQAAADLIALFSGNGADIKTGWLASLRDLVSGFVLPGLRALGDAAQFVADKFNAVFGTRFTGAGAAVAAVLAVLIGGFNTLALAVAAVFGGSSPELDKFRDGLKSIGIDVGAIKDKIVAVWEGLKAELGKIDWHGIFSGVTAKDVVETVLGLVAAFIVLRSAARLAAPLISKVLGREVSGDALIFYGILGQISGLTASFVTLLVGAAAASTLLANGFRLIGFLLAPLVAGIATVLGLPVLAVGTALAALAALGVALFFFGDQIKAALGAAWDAVASGAAAAWQSIVAIVQAAWQTIKSLFSLDTVSAVWEGIKTAAQTAWDAIVAGVSNFIGLIVSTIEGAAGSIAAALAGPFQTAAGIIGGVVDTILGWINSIISAAQTAIGLLSGLDPFSGSGGVDTGGGANAAPGLAAGGLARGPGSTTSDSFLARLSDFEFVQPARAVYRYGVDFMEAIRRGQLSLGAVRALMSGGRGFAIGGLAQRAGASLVGLPRFAEGGLATVPAGGAAGPSLAPVHFHLGGKTVGGFFGSLDAIKQLGAAAADEILTSTGPAPSWARGGAR